ncbi:MAG TPA: RidA family protein [Stellaceae bacterium]|nr:RidA family protein [Stellaceae bacterium]
MAQALSSTILPKPRFRYSPVVKAGPWIRVSGMVALDRATGALEAGGPGAEAAKILDNLTQALPELGLALDDMVAARIFTTRMDLFPDINVAWDRAIGAMATPPARTSVGVTALPLGATVEIEFEFYKEGGL